MSLLAVTVIGHDRPGIIADVTSALAEHGGNLEDSSMTLLRGHFAMMLLVSTSAPADEVEQALRPLTADGALVATVREVPQEPEDPGLGGRYVLTVRGADRPGIVSAITRVVADSGGNITDLSTRLSGQLYVLVAEVDLPDSDAGQEAVGEALAIRLRVVAGELGVDAGLHPAEPDLL